MTSYDLVAEVVASLDDDRREAYEERCSIMEFDAGLDRPIAEALALVDVLRRGRLWAIEVAMGDDGSTQWVSPPTSNTHAS